VCRSDSGGGEFSVVSGAIHENWVDTSSTTGYDIAILTRDAPVKDAGPPPTLYAGNEERGRLLTFLGYGSRGIAGLLGSGDSGGSAWLKIDGRWVLAGVNSNGTANAEAGETSWFVRISGKRGWILEHVPTARFTD